MICTNVWMKLLTTVVLTVITSFAQSSDRLPVTDAEKIADALRAGPAFVTKDATVLDWPSSPRGEFRVLRTGASAWTCLPGIPHRAHDEPGCFDQVFLQFMKDSMAGMIIGLDQQVMKTMNHDGSNGEAYVNHLPGRSELYLVIPVRQWDEQHLRE
jgi:hypothetical protein